MDKLIISKLSEVVFGNLNDSLYLATELKERYVCETDFDNAAKWRDIGDGLRKLIKMVQTPIERKESKYVPIEDVIKEAILEEQKETEDALKKLMGGCDY
jgi:hypothetical protein